MVHRQIFREYLLTRSVEQDGKTWRPGTKHALFVMWKRAAGTPLARIRRKKLQRNLRPCFETKVDRSAFPIQSANSAIEIAIDRTHIAGPDAAVSFCEIELELKAGQPDALFALALDWAGHFDCLPLDVSKAERGLLPDTPSARSARIRIGCVLGHLPEDEIIEPK